MSSSHPGNKPRYNANAMTPAKAARMLERMNGKQQVQTQSNAAKDHGAVSRDGRSTRKPPNPQVMYEGETGSHSSRDLVASNAEPEPEPEPELNLGLEARPNSRPEASTAVFKRKDVRQVRNQHVNAHIQVNQTTSTNSTTNNYYQKADEVANPGQAMSRHVQLTGQSTNVLDSETHGFLTATLNFLNGLTLPLGNPRYAWLFGLLTALCLVYLAASSALKQIAFVSLFLPRSPSPIPTVTPQDALVPGPLPTEKGLIFPFQDGSRQLILDVQRISGADALTTDIVTLFEQYASLGAKIDSDWAEALSALLSQIRSELYSIKNYPAAKVQNTWLSMFGIAKHPAVVLMEQRIQRYARNMLTGQRLIEDAKWNLTSSSSSSSGIPGQADGAMGIMSSLSLSVCAWADVHASDDATDDTAAGNDAAVVCRNLERDQNKRIKDRIELLDTFKDVLDDGQMQRASLEEDLTAARRWPGPVDRPAIGAVELKMGDVYRQCYGFATKVFYREDKR